MVGAKATLNRPFVQHPLPYTHLRSPSRLGFGTTIIVCEAVLIYVNDVRGVVRTIGEAIEAAGGGEEDTKLGRTHYIFADRLPVKYGDVEEVKRLFEEEGWGRKGGKLRDFIPKPGLASSMGWVTTD